MNLAKMVWPQANGYDSLVFNTLTGENVGKSELHPDAVANDLIFAGKVRVGYFEQDIMNPPRYQKAFACAEVFRQAEHYLQAWPEMYEQIKILVKVIQPFYDTTIHPKHIEFAVGSSSSSIGLPLGYICLTVDNPIGVAQAIVHELAHQKIRAIGIIENNTDAIFSNAPYVSAPLNINQRVLPAAAFHDIYTFTHILQLNISMASLSLSAIEKDHLYQLLLKNSIRIEHALYYLTEEIRTITYYKTFYEKLISWMKKCVQDTKRILSESYVYSDYSTI